MKDLKKFIATTIREYLNENKMVNDFYLHGTNNDEILFDEDTVFYGTKDYNFANTYGVNVYKIKFNLKKPYDLSDTVDGKFRDNDGNIIKDDDGYDYSYNYIDLKLKNRLIESGYDGVVMDENVVAFYPNQIKVIELLP